MDWPRSETRRKDFPGFPPAGAALLSFAGRAYAKRAKRPGRSQNGGLSSAEADRGSFKDPASTELGSPMNHPGSERPATTAVQRRRSTVGIKYRLRRAPVSVMVEG